MPKLNMRDAVTLYQRLGWSIIPCRPNTKIPNLRSWKEFQQRLPRSAEISRWIESDCNIAVIAGSVSDGLVIRDFDSPSTYSDWKRRKPALAKKLPTVRTGNGFHVYCRMRPCPRVRSKGVGCGELRGAGAYVVAPPSIHPSQAVYEWLELPAEPPPIVSLADLLLEDLGSKLTYEEEMLHSKRSEPSQHSNLSNPSQPRSTRFVDSAASSKSSDIEFAVLQSLPMSAGQRNRCLFDLARRLKAIDSQLDLVALEAVFARWWELALPTIETKDYAISEGDFLRAWDSVRVAFGETMSAHLKIAIECGVPQWVPEQFSPECKSLAALCRQLQRVTNPQPFFLSAKMASELLDVPKMTCWRWLDLFERRRAITKISNGDFKSRLASTFHYVASDLWDGVK